MFIFSFHNFILFVEVHNSSPKTIPTKSIMNDIPLGALDYKKCEFGLSLISNMNFSIRARVWTISKQSKIERSLY